MQRRSQLVASLGVGVGVGLMAGVLAGGTIGAGVFALLDLGGAPRGPISPFPILFSGPSTSLTRSKRRPPPRPSDDVPFWFPDFQDLLSIDLIDKLTEWIDRGDSQWDKLARTLLATPGIAALGLLSHLESAVRSPGPQAGTSIERPKWRR